MKKILSIFLHLLPFLVFLPLSGVSILAYQNIVLIYLCYLFCIIEAGKNRSLFIEETRWIFVTFAVVMLVIRILSFFSIPGAYHLDGFYKNDSARIYFIIFALISVLMMISFQIYLFRNSKDNLAGKICGFIGVLVFEAFILYFLVHAICNSDFYNHVVLLEEMFVQKVF